MIVFLAKVLDIENTTITTIGELEFMVALEISVFIKEDEYCLFITVITALRDAFIANFIHDTASTI